MDSTRKRSIIIGILFIFASATAIFAVILYDPILNNPDFITNASESNNQVILGAIFELILAFAAIGTSITFFPLLKKKNETLALGYVCFRLFESILIVIGLISLLSLLTLHLEFTNGTVLEISTLQSMSIVLLAIHNWTFILGPNFMLGINTIMYSTILYQTEIVPRPIASLGLIGSALILISALLGMFGIIIQFSLWAALLSMPIAIYEMILAVYLIFRGFKEQQIKGLINQ